MMSNACAVGCLTALGMLVGSLIAPPPSSTDAEIGSVIEFEPPIPTDPIDLDPLMFDDSALWLDLTLEVTVEDFVECGPVPCTVTTNTPATLINSDTGKILATLVGTRDNMAMNNNSMFSQVTFIDSIRLMPPPPSPLNLTLGINHTAIIDSAAGSTITVGPVGVRVEGVTTP